MRLRTSADQVKDDPWLVCWHFKDEQWNEFRSVLSHSQHQGKSHGFTLSVGLCVADLDWSNEKFNASVASGFFTFLCAIFFLRGWVSRENYCYTVIHQNLPPIDIKNPAYLGRGSAGKAKSSVVSYLLINGEGTNSLGLENVIRDNFVPRTLFPAPWGRGWIRHIGHRPRGIMKPRENPLMVAIRYSFRYCFALRVMRQPWRRGWRVTKCNSPHYAIQCKMGMFLIIALRAFGGKWYGQSAF